MKHPKLASNTNINQTNSNLNLFNIANNKINMLNKATRHKINMECINLQQIFMVRRWLMSRSKKMDNMKNQRWVKSQ